jgi:hypothetical protein
MFARKIESLWQLKKVSEEFLKSQRRFFKKPAKSFKKVSEDFFESQRSISSFAVKSYQISS